MVTFTDRHGMPATHVEVLEVTPGAYGIQCPWCGAKIAGGWSRQAAEEQASWHEIGCPDRPSINR